MSTANLKNIDNFSAQGEQFTTFLSKHQFLHSFIDGKVSDLPKESEIHELQQENQEKREQFLQTTAALQENLTEYNTMRNRFGEVEKRIADIIELESNAPRTASGASRRLLMDEIIETEKMLNQLKNDQSEVNNLIQKRVVKNNELNKEMENIKRVTKEKADLENNKKTPTKSSSKKSITTTSKSSSKKVSTSSNKTTEKKDEKVRLQMVLEGLQKFTGVKVIDASYDEVSNLALSVELGEYCSAIILLDSMMSVANLQIIESRVPIDIGKILSEACVLPTPQDLRQVVFVLGACQNASTALNEDIVVLKKQVLVHRLSDWMVQVTLSCGVTARLAIHECYPEVPSGVHIESLEGVGGYSPQELEEARRDANAVCFRTLEDAVTFLTNDLA